MLPSFDVLKRLLRAQIAEKTAQGFETTGLSAQLDALPMSYDAYQALARSIAERPLRSDWEFVEPNDWNSILNECRASAFVPIDPLKVRTAPELTSHLETAFLGLISGCILGKPVEVNPTMEELERAGKQVGQWPIETYVTERFLEKLGRRHEDWATTIRENIRFCAPDDDIQYALLGMELMEERGFSMKREHVIEKWLAKIPITRTFGPERTQIVKAGMQAILEKPTEFFPEWMQTWSAGEEYCGALIRVHAYGLANPGNPIRAAELAWRDAGWTHARTGLYGALFCAAAIALAPVVETPLDALRQAMDFVPRRSRFYKILDFCLKEVDASNDWIDGYARVHHPYREYTHCMIYQEIGTIFNTLKFATSVGDGICKQVMQGNDTDSFGAIAGCLLGAHFGPIGLKSKWIEPFQNQLLSGMGGFLESRIDVLAQRMGRLWQRV